MPIKYIPFTPEPVDGQAVLNFKRVLKYKGADDTRMVLQRGMPLYEVECTEQVGDNPDGNMVIRGECVSACAYLKEQGIQVDLVYIDPPFASGADYAKKVYIRHNPKVAEAIAQAEQELDIDELRAFEEKMYGDVWDKEKYLNWMYENLMAIKSVMSETASIYVHLDWHIGHYVKILMDEVFGESHFVNEIIWHYPGREMHVPNKFNAKHDTIFIYSLSEGQIINSHAVAIPYDRDERIKTLRRKVHTDEYGREWVWETRGQAAGQEPYKRYVDEIVEDGRALSDVWSDIPSLRGNDPLRNDYATEKPPALLERVIKASSDEGMLVADFFGGSGVTAAVAAKLGRRFIHCDIGLNSMQTTRDRLRANGAEFDVMEIRDGVQLYRNPIQTMEKIKSLIPGLKNEDSLDSFWEGAISDSRLGTIPVYVPNLMDSSSKLLDEVMMNRILHQAIPELDSGIKKVIVYYIDITSREEIEKFISDDDSTLVKVELRDLKTVLDDVVVGDYAEFHVERDESDLFGGYTVVIDKFISDRVMRKIDEFNQKALLNPGKKPFKPIEISAEGLELIEYLSLDCTSTDGEWHSDSELKIDKTGFTTVNGAKTKDFWTGTIHSDKPPLRLKIRNICGDESMWEVKE